MKEVLHFLRELKANNDREWFNMNKEWYLEVKRKTDALTQDLINAIAGFDPDAAMLGVADCTYRIYRDTRFSADKTPYKTHIGIFINPPKGKKSMRNGYYLHIEPDNCFLAAGTIGLPSPVIKAIRQSIFDEIEEYRAIVESEEFKAVFTVIGENLLKTAPKGFPKDWEYIDYIRPKDFCCSGFLSERFMLRKDLPEALIPALKQGKRFNDFINFTIDDFE